MRWMALAAGALVAACATVPPPPAPGEDAEMLFAARRAELAPLTDWKLRGRVALRTPEEGWQASLHWERQGARQALDLVGPFGGGHVRVVEDEGGARLQDSAQQLHYAADATALLARATGWRLPLDGLDYWVRGLPVPDLPATWKLDPQGRLTTLTQRGWRIEYLDYAEHEGRELPSRLYISRRLDPAPGPETPMLEVRFAIQQWSFPPSP